MICELSCVFDLILHNIHFSMKKQIARGMGEAT